MPENAGLNDILPVSECHSWDTGLALEHRDSPIP